MGINLNGINWFSVSNFLGKIVTNMDLYKFGVEANGLVILIQEFGENHDSGVGADFRAELYGESASENTGLRNCLGSM